MLLPDRTLSSSSSIILYHQSYSNIYNCPWISKTGVTQLKHRRTEADKKFFNSISQPDSCLHHLLPPPRDTQLITKLRYANTYPVPLIKTKRFVLLSILAWGIM